MPADGLYRTRVPRFEYGARKIDVCRCRGARGNWLADRWVTAYNVVMFYSADARSFVKEWGDSLQAVDCYDRNLVTMLAERGARGRHKRNLVSLQSAIRHGYQADIDGNIWQSALYQAVDMCNWSMADALLRFNIKRSHILKALGTLLSQAPLLDYSMLRARDEHRYALILFQRLNGATQEECRHLLSRALNGSAMAWFLPLMLNGVTIPPVEEWHNWHEGNDEFWWFCDDAAPEEKGIFAGLMRQFFRERLPRLQQSCSHHFPDFVVKDARLYYTGNPTARLPLLSCRRKRYRERMKDIERSALLFAR